MPYSSALNITWDRYLSDWVRVRRSRFDCPGEGGRNSFHRQSRPVLGSVIVYPGEQNSRTTNLITHIYLILKSRINVALSAPLPLAPSLWFLVLMLRLRRGCLIVTAIFVWRQSHLYRNCWPTMLTINKQWEAVDKFAYNDSRFQT
jgi:hypothetical protein